MTDKEEQKFAQMYLALRRIAKGYVTTDQIEKNANRLGLTSQEFMEYAYDNIQQEAKNGLKGIRLPKSIVYLTPSSGPPIGSRKDGVQ